MKSFKNYARDRKSGLLKYIGNEKPERITKTYDHSFFEYSVVMRNWEYAIYSFYRLLPKIFIDLIGFFIYQYKLLKDLIMKNYEYVLDDNGDIKLHRINKNDPKGGLFKFIDGKCVRVNYEIRMTAICANNMIGESVLDSCMETARENLDNKIEYKIKEKFRKTQIWEQRIAKRGSLNNKEWFHADDKGDRYDSVK